MLMLEEMLETLKTLSITLVLDLFSEVPMRVVRVLTGQDWLPVQGDKERVFCASSSMEDHINCVSFDIQGRESLCQCKAGREDEDVGDLHFESGMCDTWLKICLFELGK